VWSGCPEKFQRQRSESEPTITKPVPADILMAVGAGYVKLNLGEHGEIVFNITDRGIQVQVTPRDQRRMSH
jgi:hypothetical protein